MADIKPAPKDVDKALFKNTSGSIRALHRQSRKELRLLQRRKYKEDIYARQMQAAEGG